MIARASRLLNKGRAVLKSVVGETREGEPVAPGTVHF